MKNMTINTTINPNTMLQYFPFQVGKPSEMLPLEQIFCMVWLAKKYPLEDIRKMQDIVNDQIEIAHLRKMDEALDNLRMISDNLCAVVAYQCFHDNFWMTWIKA